MEYSREYGMVGCFRPYSFGVGVGVDVGGVNVYLSKVSTNSDATLPLYSPSPSIYASSRNHSPQAYPNNNNHETRTK